ncbi:MAG: hypothetical protein C0613_06390 [Desulfobulbaceae bacterium]|nr:MAG: hypothetical protein C0613_06390 [Desulfobulbaceae bacterium]
MSIFIFVATKKSGKMTIIQDTLWLFLRLFDCKDTGKGEENEVGKSAVVFGRAGYVGLRGINGRDILPD